MTNSAKTPVRFRDQPRSEKSDNTYRRRETIHAACLCCEHAAERIFDLRQSLIGAIEAVKAGRSLSREWVEANERLLEEHDPDRASGES
jgi:hypothetical protein